MSTLVSSDTDSLPSAPDVSRSQTFVQTQQSKAHSHHHIITSVLPKTPPPFAPSAVRQEGPGRQPHKKPATNAIIGRVLQGGVILSAVVIALGLLLLPT